MKVFCTKIGEIEKYLMGKLATNNRMCMTDEQQAEFDNATQCYICKKEIVVNDKKGCKV